MDDQTLIALFNVAEPKKRGPGRPKDAAAAAAKAAEKAQKAAEKAQKAAEKEEEKAQKAAEKAQKAAEREEEKMLAAALKAEKAASSSSSVGSVSVKRSPGRPKDEAKAAAKAAEKAAKQAERAAKKAAKEAELAAKPKRKSTSSVASAEIGPTPTLVMPAPSVSTHSVWTEEDMITALRQQIAQLQMQLAAVKAIVC